MAYQAIPVVTKFGLSSNGFVTYYNNTSSLYVSAGVCRDSNNIMDIVIGGPTANSPETIAPVLLDATKVGVNGLDVGNLESGAIYAVYVIGDSSGYKAAATLLVKENTDPLIPAGYDSFRLQSYIKTDGSAHITPFAQLGLSVDKSINFYESVVILDGESAIAPTNIDMSLFVPSRTNLVTVDLTMEISPDVIGSQFVINNIYTLAGMVVNVSSAGSVSNVLVNYSTPTPTIQYYVQNGSDLAYLTLNGFTFSI